MKNKFLVVLVLCLVLLPIVFAARMNSIKPSAKVSSSQSLQGHFCLGDMNDDGKVDVFDIDGFKKCLGTYHCKNWAKANMNLDFGKPNQKDLELFVETITGKRSAMCY